MNVTDVIRPFIGLLLGVNGMLIASGASAEEKLKLHVPSPDWREQVIYFLMIDRFNDGNPQNNDQGVGEYNPHNKLFYSGGDLKGVTQQLDYIKNLGASAIWITPPIANQWWNPVTQATGYHGYWPAHFMQVDKHFGSLADYQQLSHQLHSRDMYLIQDAVVNHVGHYYDYSQGYDQADKSRYFRLNRGAIPSAPTMAPFDQLDVTKPSQAQADIYHWTPPITDYSDPSQAYTHQLDWVNDLNTSNPRVRDALKKAHRFWIEQVGVDGFRLDAAKHVEHEFWHEFIHGENGVEQSAAATGRENFLTFGELFNFSQPMEDDAEQLMKGFLGTPEKPEIRTLMGFPLYKDMQDVFNGGLATSRLSYRLQSQFRHFDDPFNLLNFVDNHDVQRFVEGGNIHGLKQAFSLIFTAPGIPVIYQGDEQLFRLPRKAMFKQGYGATEDSFNQQSEMYQYLSRLAELRRQYRGFSHGALSMLANTDKGPGILAYKRSYQKQQLLVLMNTSDSHRILQPNLPTQLAPGTLLKPVFQYQSEVQALEVNDKGSIAVTLAPRAVLVLKAEENSPLTSRENGKSVQNNHIQVMSYDPLKVYHEKALISGKSSFKHHELLLVIDHDPDKATPVKTDGQGNWQAWLPVEDLGRFQRPWFMYEPDSGTSSQTYEYIGERLKPDWQLTVDDPVGDDQGHTADYHIPTDASYADSMDIVSVEAKSAGHILELEVELAQTSDVWGYAYNFDHLVLTSFFDLPHRTGLTQFPLLSAQAPDGFQWNFAHKAYGLGGFIYHTEQASETRVGDKLSVAPEMEMDHNRRKLILRYDGRGLGLTHWQGVKIYLTSWDADETGQYRRLEHVPGQWHFASIKGKAKILDSLLVTLPGLPKSGSKTTQP